MFLHLQKELHAKKDCPHMCAYKLVTVKFKWWGLQNKVENFIQKVSMLLLTQRFRFQPSLPQNLSSIFFFVPKLQQEKRLFTNFHRQLFCWIDKWIDLNMEDIRRMEEQTRRELDEVSRKGKKKREDDTSWMSESVVLTVPSLCQMRVKDPVKGMVALED